MPLYEYGCDHCGAVTEQVFKMASKPDTVSCPECGRDARQRVAIGGIESDEPAWLYEPGVRESLQPPEERPVATRSEYRRYLKDRGIAERH